MLALAACVEYVAPPLPGDAFALAGVVLAATAGWSPLGVHLSLTFGACVGGHIAWRFGRWLDGRRDRWPSWMTGPRVTRLLEKTQQKFDTHGAIILGANRFLPALRAFFFVGAGLSNVPLRSVWLWGGLSAAVWNGLLLGLGWSLGSMSAMEDAYGMYAMGVLALLVMVGAIWFARSKFR
jgi:membrane protein DedA with SNARE-associated domain